MSGVIYDSTESKRMDDFLSNQSKNLTAIDNEKEVMQKLVLKYSILVAGSVVLLVGLNYILSKK
jgi:hypothetical protein